MDKVINEDKQMTSYTYQSDGLLQMITDPNKTQLIYTYSNGKITKDACNKI